MRIQYHRKWGAINPVKRKRSLTFKNDKKIAKLVLWNSPKVE